MLSVAMAGGALALVAVLEPLLWRAYFFPAFAALILSAAMAGARYGVLTSLLFAVGYGYWFLEPRSTLAVRNPHELTALVVYAVTGCFVAAIGGALRAAYTQLREQHELLDAIHRQREDLLRALTHDIRSPLSVIAMNAAMIERSDPATAARRGALIRSSVAKVDAMLRDLVEVVALESGKLKLESTPLDVAAVLNQLKEELAESLPMERVNVAAADDLPVLQADRQRLERVFVNLVSNALKYSAGPVTVRAYAQHRNVVVAVSDEGPGIPATDLPHIFEKYYRARTAEAQEGLGLGLYISRLLVEAHGGRIWAESVVGKGSTFHVAVPTSTRRTAEPSRPTPAPEV